MINPHNQPQPEPLANTVTTVLIVVGALLVMFLLVLIGIPLLRDWLIAHANERAVRWLISNNIKVSAWVDWLRLVFEVLLGLFISNQVFNEQLRAAFERALSSLGVTLSMAIERSIQEDNVSGKIQESLNELLVFMHLPPNFRNLPGEIPILLDNSYKLYYGARHGLPRLFTKLLLLRLLGAFSGRLHGTFALLAFCGVVLMKVVKLYLDSPLLKLALPH